MIKATVSLKSVSPFGYSKFNDSEKLEKEGHSDYEKRTWREKAHINEDGYAIIPPMMFKNCLAACAKYLSMQIPGKGKATYTKHFEAGIMCIDPLILPIKKEDLKCETLHLPSDGRRGGTTRVLKTFPIVNSWEGDVEFHIFDETITEDVFKYHIEEAGKFVGIGRFRPRNNGYYGRFIVEDIKWEKVD